MGCLRDPRDIHGAPVRFNDFHVFRCDVETYGGCSCPLQTSPCAGTTCKHANTGYDEYETDPHDFPPVFRSAGWLRRDQTESIGSFALSQNTLRLGGHNAQATEISL